MALLRPAREVRGVEIAAVAARDPSRAQAFASKHGIPRVVASYEALIADPEIDAIYNPLPNSHHCDWTIRALEAGKHVLCEKPLANNTAEAERMAEAARRTGFFLMEAFHWRYHPLATRMKEVLENGEIGTVRHIEVEFCIPFPMPNNIRYEFSLGGGATMDTGCYAINILRHLAGAEPEVLRAQAWLIRSQVDRAMEAEMSFADGRSGRILCSLLSASLFRMSAHAIGDRGEMRVFNPIAPHIYHRLTVRNERGSRVEHVQGDATYTHQLRAFAAAVRNGRSVPSNPEDGVRNMRVIDAIYHKAGLKLRGEV